MSISHVLALGLLLLGAGPEDPAALVEQLGAPRFAEREEASRALEQLGRDALPALREAMASKDPEIRSRAAGLIGRIESRIMVRPTLVTLDFHDQPLADVVAVLSQRAGVPMHLFPENNPIWKTRRVTLEADAPVPFWEMLDRLSRAALVQPNVGAGMGLNGRNGVQLLATGSLAPAFPTSDSGPFRATLHGVHLHRDLTFGAGPVAGIAIQGRLNGPPVPPARPGAGGPAAVAVQFTVDLRVVAEPRMIVSQTGPIRLSEAVDDKGQSLLPDDTPSAHPQQRFAGYFGAYGNGMTMISTQIQLRPPAQLGQQICRLHGSVPLLVAARKEPPLTVALAEAKGKTYQAGDLSVTVHNIRPEADQMGSTSLELSVRPNAAADPAAGPNRLPVETFTFRSPQIAQSQIEILDAQGRAYPQWITSSMQTNNEESRMTLRLMPNEQLGAPAQLRLYDLARAQADAHFDFRDIPIP